MIGAGTAARAAGDVTGRGRRGIRRSLGVFLAAALALALGLTLSPGGLSMTDARFTTTERASAAGLATTSLPPITFTGCTTSGNSMILTWDYGGTAVPGQTPAFAASLGLNVIGGATASTTGPVSGVYTTTINVGALALGTYTVHATSSLHSWTGTATNNVSAPAITLVLATVWGTCTINSGA